MTYRNSPNEDLNLMHFMGELWTARLYLVVGLCVGVFSAFIMISTAVPAYRAEMMIGPTQNIHIGGTGADSYHKGNATPITSSLMQQSNRPYFTRFEAIYTGQSVAKLLLRDQRIVEGVAQDKSFFFSTAPKIENAAQMSAYLRKNIGLDPFGETDLRTLNTRHSDPAFAAYLLQQTHRTADQLIRADIRNHVDERIAYLERVIAKTLNPEHRRAMTGLLLEQERMRMMVSMDEPVAAKVIERAAAGAKPAWPDPALFYAVFAALGLLSGYLIFTIVQFITHHQSQQRHTHRSDKTVKKSSNEAPNKSLGRSYAGWFKKQEGNNNIPPILQADHANHDIDDNNKKNANDAAE